MVKKSKILIALMLALVLIVSAGCSDSGDDLKQPANVNGDSSVSDDSGNNDSNGDDDIGSIADVTIAETLLYEANGVKVTATGFENSWMSPEVKLLIENNSNKNVLLTAEYVSVNGYMMPMAGLYEEVAAGKKANSTLSFMTSELNQAGITTIADIQLILDISDYETWECITKSNLLSLSTSAAGYVQPVDDSGDVLYNSNGIKIVCKGLKQDWAWDGTIVFYIENNSGKPITVYAENVSVNGFMEDVGMWSDLRNGTRLVDGMYLLDLSDLNLESIDDVDNIEFNLRVINADNWDEIVSTDVITLNFN